MAGLIRNVTIGSDVEFFVFDERKKEFLSAEPYIPGTKQQPFKFDWSNDYFAMQLDNVLAEGNIPPAKTAEEFDSYLAFLQVHLDARLPKGCRTAAIGAARLKPAYLQSEAARTFGCDPSLSCWTNDIIRLTAEPGSLRTAGFHVHIGYRPISYGMNRKLAGACDLFLGVPATLVQSEEETLRKRFGYGAAGNFRHQPHGVEYRTLSSYFAATKETRTWVFNQTLAAVEFVNQGSFTREFIRKYGSLIQMAINEPNVEVARELCDLFSIRRLTWL